MSIANSFIHTGIIQGNPTESNDDLLKDNKNEMDDRLLKLKAISNEDIVSQKDFLAIEDNVNQQHCDLSDNEISEWIQNKEEGSSSDGEIEIMKPKVEIKEAEIALSTLYNFMGQQFDIEPNELAPLYNLQSILEKIKKRSTKQLKITDFFSKFYYFTINTLENY